MPFTPISNITMFPILVPRAKNRFPVADMAVGMPIDVLLESSNKLVTFLSITKDMFSIYSIGKRGIFCNLSWA